MPTGYTASLYEGKEITFEEFALATARGMGAAILQRDDPPGPIQEVEPSDYYEKAVARAQARLDEVSAWDDRQAEREELRTRCEQEQGRDDYVQKRDELRARYEAMLEKVQAWEPPTPDHEGFKKFMVEQLEQSISFDAAGGYLPDVRLKMTAQEYKQFELQKARDRLAKDKQYLAEDLERIAGRNAWIRALKESLGQPVSA